LDGREEQKKRGAALSKPHVDESKSKWNYEESSINIAVAVERPARERWRRKQCESVMSVQVQF
jgi:hypothetical protein